MKSILTKRALLVALIAGSGVLGASAFAMNGATADGKPGCDARHGQAMQAKMGERRDARMAALKEKLKLAPAQAAAWQTFTDAEKIKPYPQAGNRQAMREAYAKMNTPQRLDAMLEKADVRRAHQVTRAAAVKTFYAQLTPGQQAVFDSEAMALLRHGRGGHGHHGHHGQLSQQS
ncbi:MAG: hypothetical protein A2580_13105 [Hydrogenophilales bacterium RIFOXYD1_FULL_62_11]|nr:MAG: hypothetical protein A2580_13105 [Hydrogenophilales bacterium RIFOXYD1_FULL_62_11]